MAQAFHDQIESFYSLPKKIWPRKEIVFSPSGVTKCARELYYLHTGAPVDETPTIPWRERMARNGTGVHEITQSDYFRMEKALREAGHTPRFRFLEAEVKGERSFAIGDVTVKLKGRCDGKLGVLDDEGNVVREIGLEIKTKDKKTNLNKVAKEGKPQFEHQQQAVAYALIFGITDWVFQYESLQKPNWGDVNPDKPDLACFHLTVDRSDAKRLLTRLGKVVRQIEQKQLPEPELDRCSFCVFKTQCSRDGGYKA